MAGTHGRPTAVAASGGIVRVPAEVPTLGALIQTSRRDAL
jgi:hypothetical protein